MYDNRNPIMILCSQKLEQVLDHKALHIIEIKERVMDQVAWAPEYSVGMEIATKCYPFP